MVGIAQEDPRAGIVELGGRQSFDGRLGPDHHKHGRFNVAMCRPHAAQACKAIRLQKIETERSRFGHRPGSFDALPCRVGRVFEAHQALAGTRPTLRPIFQSPRSDRPSCPSFSRTSLSEVMPKFFDSSNSSALRCTRSPRVLMPSRFMHLRARTDRFKSLTGLFRTACSCSLNGCCGRKRLSFCAPSSNDWPRRKPFELIISLISFSDVSPKFLLLKSACSLTRVKSPSVRMFIFLRQLRLRTDSSKSVTGISSTWLKRLKDCSSS